LSSLFAITRRFITFPPKESMTKKTLERRTQQLIAELMQHPHKEELLCLIDEQLCDDTEVLHAEGQ
jgi:uncharacterized membrane protein affecting hemolysin expression